MRIERISDNKIRVTISINDLEERNIDLTALNYNSPAAQELFWDMMEQAEVEFGFDASDSQLVIEASPDSDEGFIVTITRVSEDGDFESIEKYIKNKYRSKDLKGKKKSRKVYSSIMIYSFSSFEDLCSLSKRILPLYTGESSLYKYKNTYYIILTRGNLSSANMKTLEILISDYGRKVLNISFYDGFLNEHGIKIAEGNALTMLNNFFK